MERKLIDQRTDLYNKFETYASQFMNFFFDGLIFNSGKKIRIRIAIKKYLLSHFIDLNICMRHTIKLI